MECIINIFKLSEQTPKDNEQVMVWDNRTNEWCQRTYNGYYEYWDTADGDDFAGYLSPDDVWFSLPGNPNLM